MSFSSLKKSPPPYDFSHDCQLIPPFNVNTIIFSFVGSVIQPVWRGVYLMSIFLGLVMLCLRVVVNVSFVLSLRGAAGRVC